ncbi:MAG: esterase-like activity of phytase family protein, partial [Gammaproteobacteria bacterium]|nr:esterase-like activity of phytase family protein [Gammaproteobacteria bacterium]
AEGLVLRGHRNGRRGDSVLTVSFERRPRLIQFTPEGRYVAAVPLPPALSDRRRY